MTFDDVALLVEGEALINADTSEVIIDHAYAADLLSDVLALTEETTTLITGTVSPQVIRVAEILNVIAIIFVRGKRPSQQIIDYAQQLDIPMLSTRKTMFETCGLLYANGVRPCKNRSAMDN